MLPLKHLCEEFVEQRSMRGHNECLVDTLSTGGGSIPSAAKKAKRGGGGGSGGRGGGDYGMEGWA